MSAQKQYEKPVWGRLHTRNGEWQGCCWLPNGGWQYKPIDVSAEFVCVLNMHTLLLNEEWEAAVNIVRKTITGYIQFIQVHVCTYIHIGVCVKLSAVKVKHLFTLFIAVRVFSTVIITRVLDGGGRGGIKKNNFG